MKSGINIEIQMKIGVAPFAGAWIEICRYINCAICFIVAPFAGAWIEIVIVMKHLRIGLVAPFAGAWIEITDSIH